jgi:photosystem II stability/assembly factor-like uncharacterized protein
MSTMKRLSLAIALTLAAACTSSPARSIETPTAPANGSESPAPSAPSTAPTATPSLGREHPTAVAFADRTHGWLGTASGIFATTDGGRTWARQLSDAPVHRLWALDAGHAWALAGADYQIVRTTDGQAWHAVPATIPPIVDLQFATPTAGWAIAMPRVTSGARPQPSATLLGSTDGGLIWRPITDRSISSVCFVNETDGWGADGKRVFKTNDGGHTWSQLVDLAIGDQGPWYPTIRCAGPANARVQITEPYAALSHAPYLVFRTSDAGRTWLLEYREGYTLGSTTPQDTPELGSYPSLFGTFADGRTWFVSCTPPVEKQSYLVARPTGEIDVRGTIPSSTCVADARFVDALHGWVLAVEYAAAGPRTLLLSTADGGQTWARLAQP